MERRLLIPVDYDISPSSIAKFSKEFPMTEGDET
jgi:hypothetical protein